MIHLAWVSGFFFLGQTGSGKTYTIFGEGDADRRGLLPRTVEYLFDRIEECSERKEIGMVCSFLEIYLDQIRDLGRAYLADRKTQKENQNSSTNYGGQAIVGAVFSESNLIK